MLLGGDAPAAGPPLLAHRGSHGRFAGPSEVLLVQKRVPLCQLRSARTELLDFLPRLCELASLADLDPLLLRIDYAPEARILSNQLWEVAVVRRVERLPRLKCLLEQQVYLFGELRAVQFERFASGPLAL